jgi:hypothetical protein
MRLNFIVDGQLIIKMLGSENMDFIVDQDELLGQHIMKNVPLSEDQRAQIQSAFDLASESRLTQTVQYEVQQSPSSHFTAKITPLSDETGTAGYFVMVTPIA